VEETGLMNQGCQGETNNGGGWKGSNTGIKKTPILGVLREAFPVRGVIPCNAGEKKKGEAVFEKKGRTRRKTGGNVQNI